MITMPPSLTPFPRALLLVKVSAMAVDVNYKFQVYQSGDLALLVDISSYQGISDMPPKKKGGAAAGGDEGGKMMLLGRPGNNVKMGIVGLPNVGKSSLFNCLAGLVRACGVCGFCSSGSHLAFAQLAARSR